jgi:hypothetical protein
MSAAISWRNPEARASAVTGLGLGATSGAPSLPAQVMIVMIGGQSLSNGGGDLYDAAAQATYANGFELCNDAGTYTLPASGNAWGLCPIEAYGRSFVDAAVGAIIAMPYPNNYLGPSFDRQFQIDFAGLLQGGGYPAPTLVTSSTGVGGGLFTQVGYGGSYNSFDAGFFEMREIAALASNSGRTSAVAAFVFVHGEADCAAPVATYQANLATECSAVQTYYRQTTGQTRAIPCIIAEQDARCQSAAPVYAWSEQAQLMASQAGAGVMGSPQIAGATYMMPRDQVSGDYAHMTLPGYKQLGALIAKVAYHDERYLDGAESPRWEATQPLKVTSTDATCGALDPGTFTVSGNDITVQIHTPNPPLQTDCGTFGAPHQTGTYSTWGACVGWGGWVGGLAGTPVHCSSISYGACIGHTCPMTIHFGGPIDTIEYAHTPDTPLGGATCQGGGRCGCVRDQGEFTDPSTGAPIYSYLTQFFQCAGPDGGPF